MVGTQSLHPLSVFNCHTHMKHTSRTKSICSHTHMYAHTHSAPVCPHVWVSWLSWVRGLADIPLPVFVRLLLRSGRTLGCCSSKVVLIFGGVERGGGVYGRVSSGFVHILITLFSVGWRRNWQGPLLLFCRISYWPCVKKNTHGNLIKTFTIRTLIEAFSSPTGVCFVPFVPASCTVGDLWNYSRTYATSYSYLSCLNKCLINVQLCCPWMNPPKRSEWSGPSPTQPMITFNYSLNLLPPAAHMHPDRLLISPQSMEVKVRCALRTLNARKLLKE